jgi:hypothetical protein
MNVTRGRASWRKPLKDFASEAQRRTGDRYFGTDEPASFSRIRESATTKAFGFSSANL